MLIYRDLLPSDSVEHPARFLLPQRILRAYHGFDTIWHPPLRMSYHAVVSQIVGLLQENHCWFETFEHEPVRTSEEASKTRPGYTLHQGAKAMVVRVKRSESDKRFAMLVFPADLRFDNAKVKALFGAKDIRFATEEEISNLTGGVQPGAVPPFGNFFNLEVIADPGIFENEKIVFNAGDRCFSLAMKSQDYRALVKPQVSSIVRSE